MKSTTTVIELLAKIANGEEAPKKIKYDNTIFNLVINDFGSIYYKNEYGKDLFNSYNIYRTLNDEVEIIEDDKTIRKLPKEVRQPNNFEEVVYIAEDLVNKINEIIDKINKMED